MFEGFLSELKRRHVIRVAGVYTVAAWAVFQVVKTLFETLDFPKWTSTLALALLALGLPVVLVVSWIFERTPKGELAVTPDAPEGVTRPKLSRMDMLLLAAMVVVVGLAGAQIGGYLGGGKATILGVGAPEKSVAVLPFVVFAAEKESDYFADGLTEEVINSLAQVPDLKVAGRTSAFYFKGKNEDLREVGRRLGVSHVVEGSVRRDGDRLRVTAQLVSVKDGFHVWSKTYDRKLTDAFAIQSEIGQAVAEALKTKLEMKSQAKGVARDPAGYQLQITSRAHMRRQSRDDLRAARAGFEQLMRLEPQNAAGYAGYAQATITLAQDYLDLDFDEAQRLSEAAVDKAIQLDPKSAEVWIAKAWVSRVLAVRVGGARYDKAFDEAARRAVALQPKNAEALTLLAAHLADGGQPAQALDAARKAAEADPLSRSALVMLARSLARADKLDEAERGYRSVNELYPDFSEGRYQLAMLLVERGRLDQAVPWIKAAAAAGDDPYVAMEASWVFTNLGLTADAEAALAAIKTSPGKELIATGSFAERGDWVGMLAYARAQEAASKEPFWHTVVFQAAAQLGRDEEALATVRKIRPDLLSPDAQVSATDLQMASMVAHVLRRQGDPAQANLLLDRVVAATAPVEGARTPNEWRLARAKAFAERGQADAAVGELQAAADAGWRTAFLPEDYVWIEQHPILASLKTDARFKALMVRVRQDLAKQKAAVLATRR